MPLEAMVRFLPQRAPKAVMASTSRTVEVQRLVTKWGMFCIVASVELLAGVTDGSATLTHR